MPHNRRTTLSDVAAAAGVSPMTVSRVLRGTGTVSARTRDNVQAVVERLGYVPNRLAGSLANARSNQVAVVIPSLANNVFTEVVAGIADALEKAGYNPVIGISNYDLAKEEELLLSMMSWRPAGVIVPNVMHTTRARNLLHNAGVPVVEMMSLTERPVDMCVGLDQAAAGRAMGEHLVARGYRRFGYVGWHEYDYSAALRLRAMSAVMAGAGATMVQHESLDRPPDLAAGKAGLRRLLLAHPRVEAVVFSNDTAAVGGYLHCIEAGIDVQGGLALAGFSGLQIGQTMPRKLTTVLTQRFEIGRLSARCILNRLAGQVPPRVTDVRFELIPGQTT